MQAQALEAYVASQAAERRRERALTAWLATLERLELQRDGVAAELWAAVEGANCLQLLLGAVDAAEKDGAGPQGDQANGGGTAAWAGWAEEQATRLLEEARAHAAAGQSPGLSTDLVGRVIQLCWSMPLADAQLKTELLEDAKQRQAAFEQQRALATEARRAFRRRGSMPSCRAASNCGEAEAQPSSSRSSSWEGGAEAASVGWSAAEHAVWVQVRTECLVAGRSQAAMLECLEQRLPQRTPQELHEHEAWQQQACQLRAEASRCQAAWEDDASASFAAAGTLLDESAAACLVGAEAAGQQLELAIKGLQAASTREAWHAEHVSQQLAALPQLVADAEASAAAEAVRQHQEQDRRGRMRELFEQHRVEQRRLAAEREAADQAAAAAAEREAAAAAAANRERVAYRRDLQQAQRAARAEQEGQRRRREEERDARLAALRAEVAPPVERDTARATAQTSSSKAAASKKGQVFKEMFGWSTEALLKDQRFRLVEALRAGA